MEIRAEFLIGIDPENNAEDTMKKVYPLTPPGFHEFLDDTENWHLLDAFATDANMIEF